MSLVVSNLEREGVRLMRVCEPREVRMVKSEEEGEKRLEVTWYNKTTGENEHVSILYITTVHVCNVF